MARPLTLPKDRNANHSSRKMLMLSSQNPRVLSTFSSTGPELLCYLNNVASENYSPNNMYIPIVAYARQGIRGLEHLIEGYRSGILLSKRCHRKDR